MIVFLREEGVPPSALWDKASKVGTALALGLLVSVTILAINAMTRTDTGRSFLVVSAASVLSSATVAFLFGEIRYPLRKERGEPIIYGLSAGAFVASVLATVNLMKIAGISTGIVLGAGSILSGFLAYDLCILAANCAPRWFLPSSITMLALLIWPISMSKL